MATKKNIHLKVNEPHVVHETIEGEAILLNLGTGDYYSIEWPGTIVWDLLSETGNVEEIKHAFLEADDEKQDEIKTALDNFVESLIEEELLVATENGESTSFQIDEKVKSEFEKAIPKLDKLVLHKYSDMKDMLLLDPIHDVDEKGWPEPKKNSKEEK